MFKTILFSILIFASSSAFAQPDFVDLQTPIGPSAVSYFDHVADTCALRFYPFVGKTMIGMLKVNPTKSRRRKVRVKLINLKLTDGKDIIPHTTLSKKVFRCIRSRMHKKRFFYEKPSTYGITHRFPTVLNANGNLDKRTAMRIIDTKIETAKRHCGVRLVGLTISLTVGTNSKVRSIVVEGHAKKHRCIRRQLIKKLKFPKLKNSVLIKALPNLVNGERYQFSILRP